MVSILQVLHEFADKGNVTPVVIITVGHSARLVIRDYTFVVDSFVG